MSAPKEILLINQNVSQYVKNAIRKAADKLGRELVIKNKDSFKEIMWDKYDVTILDESTFSNLLQTISIIQSHHSKNKIVIFSNDPTWRQARKFILAGAADYTSKSSDKIFSSLETNLPKPDLSETKWRFDNE